MRKTLAKLILFGLSIWNISCSSMDNVGKWIYRPRTNANHLRVGMEVPRIAAEAFAYQYRECMSANINIQLVDRIEFRAKILVDSKKTEILDLVIESQNSKNDILTKCYDRALERAKRAAQDKWNSLVGLYLFDSFIYLVDGEFKDKLIIKIHDVNNREEIRY